MGILNIVINVICLVLWQLVLELLKKHQYRGFYKAVMIEEKFAKKANVTKLRETFSP